MLFGSLIGVRLHFSGVVRSIRQPVVIFGLVIIASIWIATTTFIIFEGEALRGERKRDATNFSLVVQQDVAETVSAIDRALKTLRWIEQHDNYRTDWPEVLAEHQRLDDLAVQLAVTDTAGLMISSSADLYPKKPLDLSDRPHFRAQLSSQGDELYISQVMTGRVSGKATVQFSRKRTNASGDFRGILVLSLPADQFQRHFAKLELGDNGGLLLLGDDGYVRAGSGIFRDRVGERIERGAENLLTSGVVSERRIVGTPLIVIARLPAIETDPNWRLRRASHIGGAALASVVALLSTLGVAVRRQRYEDYILRLSHFDPLTQLANRHSLALRLAELHKPTAAVGGFALLIIDLDRFKIVNDTFGHSTGDELLQEVAVRLRALVGPGDMIARLGGDEFALVLSIVDYEREASALAQHLKAALARPFALPRATLQVGASVGIALGGWDAQDPVGLMKAADLALYAAKADGRGCHRFYSASMNEFAQNRMLIETGLRSALANGELYLVYQPIVSALSQKIQGFEALMRWRPADGRQIGPAEFIPVAEDIGLIGEFGAWALRRACRDIAEVNGEYSISVNCSPAQLSDADYSQTVQAALAESGLAARRLYIEITESMLIKDRERILEQLNGLRALGVNVSIDDFGTGYSCLSYLEMYPIGALKIDRQFVCKIGKRPGAEETLRSIIQLAASFGMKTIAEGVETAEQFQILRELRCDSVQGYFFGRPGALEQVLPTKSSIQTAA